MPIWTRHQETFVIVLHLFGLQLPQNITSRPVLYPLFFETPFSSCVQCHISRRRGPRVVVGRTVGTMCRRFSIHILKMWRRTLATLHRASRSFGSRVVPIKFGLISIVWSMFLGYFCWRIAKNYWSGRDVSTLQVACRECICNVARRQKKD